MGIDSECVAFIKGPQLFAQGKEKTDTATNHGR